MRRGAVAAGVLAAAALVAFWILGHRADVPPSGPFPDDGAVLALVQALRAPAAALAVEGDARDWRDLPEIADPRGDAGSDPALDLVAVAVAPTAAGLHVLLRTAGPPSRADRTYWLDVDAAGEARPELQVGLSPDGRHRVRVFDAAAPAALRRENFPVSVGRDAVEAMLPWPSLQAWSPRSAPFHGPGARDWVRVVASTWEPGADAVADVASAASYRLDASSPAPGGSTSEAAPAAAALPLPVAGAWLVSQEAGTALTHAGTHAYDLARTDEGLQPAPPGAACRLSSYRAWERPVRAPVAGRVRVVRDGAPDRHPCRAGRATEPNEVVLDVGDGLALRFLHLRQGSAAVLPGRRVLAGDLLALVGSSGASSGPHLHVELVRSARGGTRPLAFRDVRVGLNPGPDDPWARTLPVWSPRAGFFVAPAGPGDPRPALR